MRRFAFLGSALGLMLLSGCNETTVTVGYKLQAPVDLELYAESYFATVDMEGTEQMGTITAAYADLNYSSSGDTVKVKRKYVMDKSRGYLKNFMPSELAFRIKEVDLAAVDRVVTSLEGIDDGYDTLLTHIPMPEAGASNF